MSNAATPRCSSANQEPRAGPDWRDVRAGAEETGGAAAAGGQR